MAEGLEQIAALPDPVGEITDLKYRPTGIQVGKMRVPLGVVGIVYESRPNVTADAAGLCLKSGNAAILRGGSEAIHSNAAIAACVHEGLRAAGLPESAVQVVATTDRAAVGHLITDEKHVDVIVPRGGKGLIERITPRSEGAGDQAPRRRLPRLCRRCGRRRHGRAHRRQRQDAALLAMQHDGDAARACRDRAARAAEAGRDLRREGRGAARRRALARARGGDEAGDRGRLVHRVPRADPRRARRRLARRGDRAHREVRLATYRRHRDRTITRRRCASCARSIRAR